MTVINWEGLATSNAGHCLQKQTVVSPQGRKYCAEGHGMHACRKVGVLRLSWWHRESKTLNDVFDYYLYTLRIIPFWPRHWSNCFHFCMYRGLFHKRTTRLGKASFMKQAWSVSALLTNKVIHNSNSYYQITGPANYWTPYFILAHNGLS